MKSFLVKATSFPAVILAMLCPSNSFAEVIVIGDSYSMSSFTDGPVWPELLSERFEGLARPRSYAQGGAETDRRMVEQVARYIDQQMPDSNDLFGIWGGAADFILRGQRDASVPVANIANLITTLSNAGGMRFLVGLMPVLVLQRPIKKLLRKSKKWL